MDKTAGVDKYLTATGECCAVTVHRYADSNLKNLDRLFKEGVRSSIRPFARPLDVLIIRSTTCTERSGFKSSNV